MKTSYQVIVKTSSGYSEGGTNATVETQFVGEDGKTTDWTKLDHWFHNDFEQGSTDKYNVSLEDVGMPCIVRFRLNYGNHTKNDNWMCDYVVVKYGEKSKTFPLYNFVETSVDIVDSDTELPQKISVDLVKNQRRKNLQKMKELVRWSNEDNKTLNSGMMRFCDAAKYDDLPSFMRNYTTRHSEVQKSSVAAFVAGKIQQMKTTIFQLTTLESYQTFYGQLEGSAHQTRNFLDGWDTDEGFGWQILNGISPLGFTACREIPSYFNVSDADLKGLLGPGKTIESELKAGKLYIMDYTGVYRPGNGFNYQKNIHGTPCDIAPAVILFHVDSHGKFLPRAIQLKPNDRDYLFVSEDSHDWLLAKMYARNAGMPVHERIYHALNTHASIEPFQVAVYRCLSIAHPIYKLLRPHIRTVAAINATVRPEQTNPQSISQLGKSIVPVSMMKHYYKIYHLDDLNIPKVLEKAGVNPDNIPEYYYGQESLKLWGVIKNYVAAMVNLFYKSNKDVIEDPELQEFAHEIAHEGFGWEDKNLRGVPDKFTTREELIELCTIVIATSSVQHAAVNFSQYESLKFGPNYPGIMNLPPHKRGEGNMKRIMDTLPNNKQMFGTVMFAYIGSKPTSDEEYLGTVHEVWFYEAEAKEIQRQFQDQLKKLDDEWKARNSKMKRPYIHLLPSAIPSAIAI